MSPIKTPTSIQLLEKQETRTSRVGTLFRW